MSINTYILLCMDDSQKLSLSLILSYVASDLSWKATKYRKMS